TRRLVKRAGSILSTQLKERAGPVIDTRPGPVYSRGLPERPTSKPGSATQPARGTIATPAAGRPRAVSRTWVVIGLVVGNAPSEKTTGRFVPADGTSAIVLSSGARRAPHSLDYPAGMEGRNPLFARTGQQKSQPRNPGVRKKGNDDPDLPQTHSLSAHQEGRKFTPRAGGHGRRCQ